MRLIFLLLLTLQATVFAETSVKPSALTGITNSQAATNDLFLLFDTSAGITKKFPVSEMDLRYGSGGGSGTVTSVAASVPSALLSISGSPITSSGTLAFSLPNRSANTVFAGPLSGSSAAPAFRLLGVDDIPSLATSKITSGVFSIARGGTNSSTALNNNRLMQSSGDAIVEASAITASRVLTSDSNGIPTHSTVTSTTLGYLDASSSIQTQLNAKQASGNYITDLTSDVTASGPGSAAATIANNVVSNAKLSTISTARIKGRVTAGTGNVEDLTGTQATSLLDAFVGDSGSGGTKGLVPAPTTGDANKYLKGNATWATITAGDVSGPSSSTDTAVCLADGTTGKQIKYGAFNVNSSGEIRFPAANSSGIAWGGGSQSIKYNNLDIELYVGGANSVKIQSTGATITGAGAALTYTAVGSTSSYKTGTGQMAGNATLVGGTVTVTNTYIASGSVIILGRKTIGGTAGNLTYTLSAGASFTINSDNPLDTSTVSYLIVQTN